ARTSWSNLPASVRARIGLPYSGMDDGQKALAEALLVASTSDAGFASADGVRTIDGERAANGDSAMDADAWYFTVYDTPSADEPWAWRYDGHHYVMTFTLVGDGLSFAPSFLGTEPMTWTEKGDHAGLAPLDRITMAALAAWESLDDYERAASELDGPDGALNHGPGEDELPEAYLGVPLADLDVTQRELMLDAIAAWILVGPEPHASVWLSEIEAGLDQVAFGWSKDPTDPAGNAYFRWTSPLVWIEYENPSEDHIHSVLRDPRDDYGRDLLAEHKAEAHP
ncbi:MAG: DUF3500 domain-containing protein, partial [Proteobacteria bacterium]|nr:DUF3500 domain-containing protein [Pseudomonadota bacterium]